MNLKFLKKSDVALIIVLLIISAICLLPKYLSKSDSLTAVILKDGQEIERIDLGLVTEEYEIDLECTPKATITVGPNYIFYSYAECPDKLCVNTGKLTHAGDTAACIPSKTLVVLEGEKSSDQPDVITY